MFPGRSPRASFVLALFLTAVGFGRFITDVLTDMNPTRWADLAGTPWRYLARAPSDGTLIGDLNVQWFKLLAIPALVSGLYVAKRVFSADPRDAERRWRSPWYQGSYLALFFAMCAVMEVEKATHMLHLRMAGLLDGERSWINHVAHSISLLLGWFLMRWMSFPAAAAPARTEQRMAPS